MLSAISIVIFGFIFYVLYISGNMVINAKRAVMFVGNIRGYDSCRARFSSCDGYMKRVMRFHESRTYHFVLQCELTRGTMSVEVLDSNKQKILEIDKMHPSASIDVDRSKRYYLVFRFQLASGNYELRWD